jgi:ATP-binding cassette subfamily F protein 3
MINAENLSVYFGARPVLKEVSFRLGNAERVAIVGPNGAGKSTLLKCCAGLLKPDEGRVSMPNRCRIGYLSQDTAEASSRTVFDEVMTVFGEAEDALKEMRRLEHQMGEIENHDSPEFHKIADRYDFLQQEIMRLDAYSAEARASRVLHGLGFEDKDFHKAHAEFSGGWRMRTELAKILLSAPDILLLDEPTNYLDIETMLWLERHLLDQTAAMIFVSHEKAFMDRLAQRVFEVTLDGRFAIYKGNYTKYRELREERRMVEQQAYDNQQAKIKHMDAFIARFRVTARRAAQAQSRIKSMDKMEIVAPPPPDPQSINFKFPPTTRANRRIVELQNATKKYGNHTVLEDVDFMVERGDKIALVGHNGAGKSTLIKLLTGVEPLSSGTVKVGEMTEMAYFAQHQFDDLSPERTVYDELATQTRAGSGNTVRDLAGAFLFHGDDVNKTVSVLSGGEKTRLRLAKMLLGGGNFLLLDEPTNHLDIAARGTLERALQQFDGAFIIVSHDRTFVDKVVTKICEVANHQVTQFTGTFEDYVRQIEEEQAKERAKENGLAISASAPGLSSGGDGKSKGSEKKSGSAAPAKPAKVEMDPREARKRLRLLRQEAEQLEERIQELETEQSEIDVALGDPSIYSAKGNQAAKLTKRRETVSAKLEETVRQWSKAGEEIEALTALETQ